MQHNVTRPFAKGGQPGFIARSAVRCGEPHQGPSGGVCHVAKGQCGMKVNKTCAGCSPPAGSCHGSSCPGWANSTECYHGVDDVEEGLQVRTRIISFAPFRSLPKMGLSLPRQARDKQTLEKLKIEMRFLTAG